MTVEKLAAIRTLIHALNEPTDEIDAGIVDVTADVKALEDQVGKIPALEATAKAVTETDLAHKATQAELSTAHQKISELEHQVVRCRTVGADLQRQVDELTKRNTDLERGIELAKA